MTLGAPPAAASDRGDPPATRTGSSSRTLHTALLGLVSLLLCELFAPGGVLPSLDSPCGRLRRIDFAHDPVSFHSVELAVPAGRTWRALELSYGLSAGEALSFILNRGAGRFHVLRLSRNDRLPSGIVTLSDDRVVDRRELDAHVGDSSARGLLRIERIGGGAAVSRDGVTIARIPSIESGRPFQVAMFPPASGALFSRVALGRVELDDGRPLPAHVFTAARIAPLLALLASVLATVLVARRWGASLESLFPVQARLVPEQLTVFLVLLLIEMLTVAAFARRAVRPDSRVILCSLAVLALAISVVFMRLRERILGHWPRLATRWLFRRWALVPSFVIGTAMLLYSVLAVMTWVGVQKPSPATVPATAAEAPLRILCYGGSTTRGYPFPSGSAYPEILDERLRAAVPSAAFVLNLSMDAGNLGHIEERLAGDVKDLRPTWIVIDSVLNDLGLRSATYRERLTRIVHTAKSAGVGVVLVKEPTFNAIYREPGRELADLYATVDELGRSESVTVVDPAPLFQANRDGFLFIDEIGHLTRFGHLLMVNLLDGVLRPTP